MAGWQGRAVALNPQRHSGCGSCDGQQCPGTNRSIVTYRDLRLWLSDHGVLGREIDGESPKFLFDVYKWKSSKSSEQNSMRHQNRELGPLSHLPDLSQCTDPELLK